jgi:hypothetical protein
MQLVEGKNMKFGKVFDRIDFSLLGLHIESVFYMIVPELDKKEL